MRSLKRPAPEERTENHEDSIGEGVPKVMTFVTWPLGLGERIQDARPPRGRGAPERLVACRCQSPRTHCGWPFPAMS